MDETKSKKPCTRHTAVPDDLSPDVVKKELELMSFAIVSHSQCPGLTRRDEDKSASTRDDY